MWGQLNLIKSSADWIAARESPEFSEGTIFTEPAGKTWALFSGEVSEPHLFYITLYETAPSAN